MSFAMLMLRRPASQQGANNNYKESVAEEARRAHGDAALMEGDLYARIIWLHNIKARGDIDNIVKPILDALKGVVYADDSSIAQCLSQHVDATRDYEFSPRFLREDIADELRNALAQSESHMVYVEVGIVPTQRIRFGLIDGGDK